MFKSTAKSAQRRRDAGLQAAPRPDANVLLKKERHQAEQAAKKATSRARKKGIWSQIKDNWDD